jgi:hypothetical protein
MRFKPFIPVVLIFLVAPIACGAGGGGRLSLSGTVATVPSAPPGPLFVALAATDDLAAIERDPLGTIKELITVEESGGTFSIDLSGSELRAGDEIAIIAFVDSDYDGGVPYPTAGDMVGLYIDREAFSMTYRLREGANDGISIEVNRVVYDFNASVSGSLEPDGPADCVLIAYAGEINSLDFTSLDFDAVIGYRKISVSVGNAPYTMKILPYGFDAPVSNVYLLALIDHNGNGVPDAGDGIGYYSDHPSGLPSLISIDRGNRTGIDIREKIVIPAPSGHAISLAGSFIPPPAYGADSPPVFIIVARSSDPAALFTDPLAVIRQFHRLPDGTREFDIDLSTTGLAPGDEVMVLALWDLDFTAGFPDPGPGDYAGFYQNSGELRSSIVLQEGRTTLRPGSDGWSFALKRKIFEHTASVLFTMEAGALPVYGDNDRVIVVAVHRDGFNLLQMKITDMDYIVGMTSLPLDFSTIQSMNIFPALYGDPNTGDTIVGNPFELRDIYLFAVLDNTPANGSADDGEYLGYYYTRIGINPFYIYLPAPFSVIDGPVTLPRGVRFTNQRY